MSQWEPLTPASTPEPETEPIVVNEVPEDAGETPAPPTPTPSSNGRTIFALCATAVLVALIALVGVVIATSDDDSSSPTSVELDSDSDVGSDDLDSEDSPELLLQVAWNEVSSEDRSSICTYWEIMPESAIDKMLEAQTEFDVSRSDVRNFFNSKC